MAGLNNSPYAERPEGIILTGEAVSKGSLEKPYSVNQTLRQAQDNAFGTVGNISQQWMQGVKAWKSNDPGNHRPGPLCCHLSV